LAGYKISAAGEIKLITFELLDRAGMVSHAFTTRLGGLSGGPYSSLNLALHVGDSPGLVLGNRRLASQALGAGLEDMVCGEQVHGDRVQVITAADRGRGASQYGDAIPGTDALVTDCPGVLLASFYADCVPVLILDPVRRAVGLAHAGWKGTVKRIAAAAVRAMEQAFHSDPENLLAVIAPAIGHCCYEIDRPVMQAIVQGGFDPGRCSSPAGDGRWRLDLPGMNREILAEAGVKRGSISLSGLCTACRPDLFFSYRGQSGICGRMASLIMLK